MSLTAVPCLLYTQDEALSHQVSAFLDGEAYVHPHLDLRGLEPHIRRARHSLLLLDLRAEGSLALCRDLLLHRGDVQVIAIGVSGSVPMAEAAALNVFASEDLPLERAHFQSLVRRSVQFLSLRIEVNELRNQIERRPEPPPAAALPSPLGTTGASPSALGSFSRSLRNIQNLSVLMENIVESVAGTCLVSRVGIFSRTRDDAKYRMYAGLRCLDEASRTVHDPNGALVRWLEMHACQVVRNHLAHIADINDRLMLQRELDLLGAEVILPLQGRTQLWGWVFVGQRGTGIPFSHADLEQMLVMADHISTTLENAFLYEEAEIQRTLAETLLHTVPSGIVSIGMDGEVRSMNRAAEQCLGIRQEEVRRKPVGILGSRMADVLFRALHREPVVNPQEWTDPTTQRSLVVEARRLMKQDRCLGAVAFLQDITNQRRLEEKQEQVERAEFWTELAASMSHEVRNPLVAIKTFAQLLPERFDDDDFRAEFSRIVTVEVDRLNKIIEQINDFANPPTLHFRPLSVEQLLKLSIGKARMADRAAEVPIHTAIEPDLPPVSGDMNSLAECLGNLITNALEATYDRGNPMVEVRARTMTGADGQDQVVLTVADNGAGIPPEFGDKVFSPFCTSKPRGMGLGLPIAKRTIIDHNGSIDIDTTPEGTQIVVTLPLEKQGAVR